MGVRAQRGLSIAASAAANRVAGRLLLGVSSGADIWCLLSRRAFPPASGNREVGGAHPGEIGAVSRGIVAARTRLAGEKYTIVHGCREHVSAVRLAGHGIGVGAAGERIDTPAMKMKRLHAVGEGAAQQAGEFADGKVDECRLAAGFKICGQASPKISFDLRPAEGSEVIDTGIAAVGAAKKAAV